MLWEHKEHVFFKISFRKYCNEKKKNCSLGQSKCKFFSLSSSAARANSVFLNTIFNQSTHLSKLGRIRLLKRRKTSFGNNYIYFRLQNIFEYFLYFALKICEILQSSSFIFFTVFTSGNIHGNSQPHGTLMEPYVFLQAALWEGLPLTISVPQPSGPTRYEGNIFEPQPR